MQGFSTKVVICVQSALCTGFSKRIRRCESVVTKLVIPITRSLNFWQRRPIKSGHGILQNVRLDSELSEVHMLGMHENNKEVMTTQSAILLRCCKSMSPNGGDLLSTSRVT